MNDKDGNNLIAPIFDIYLNSISDAIFQGQQIGAVPFIELCDPIIVELFSTIDVTINNKYLDGYIIDNEIIKLEGLYLDGNFTKPVLGTYSIKHNISNNIRYIVFDTQLPLTQSNIFIQKVYRDKQILQNIWGNLINYKKQIPDYNTLSDGFIVDFTSIQSDLISYKNQIIALYYGLINGPSINSMRNGLGIFLGLKYATFDGIVTDLSSGVTIESLDRLTTYNAPCIPRTDLIIGSLVKKYDLLEQPTYTFYDIYNNPAAFTQILLEGQADKYFTLLNIDTANQEQYAHLTFDSTISFDDVNIYWDMGNGTGLVKDLTGTTLTPKYDPLTPETRFDSWVSPLFNNEKIYEMFRNLFIVRVDSATNANADFTYYLNRIKPIWTKYITSVYV
jgi:hypothetical protein